MDVDEQTSDRFTLSVTPQHDRVVIVPRGELDLATTEPVERQALAVCRRGFRDLCLDLSALTFFDSSALRLLIRLQTALGEHGCRFSIIPGDGAARRVLELTATLDRFERSER